MTSIIGAITAVFSAVSEWFTTALNSVVPIFYVADGANQGLTFIGTVTLIGLGIAVTLLLINMIKSFIRFR